MSFANEFPHVVPLAHLKCQDSFTPSTSKYVGIYSNCRIIQNEYCDYMLLSLYHRKELMDKFFTEFKRKLKILCTYFINIQCDYPWTHGRHQNTVFILKTLYHMCMLLRF